MTSPVLTSFSSDVYKRSISLIQKQRNATLAQQSNSFKYPDTAAMQRDGVLNDYCSTINTVYQTGELHNTNIGVNSKLSAQQHTIEQVQTLVESMKSMIMSYNSSTSTINVGSIATIKLEELGLTLNKTVGNSFLFGGLNGDIPPIEDIKKFLDLKPSTDGTISSEYTNLVPDNSSTQIDLRTSIKVSIDATNPAFATTITALQTAKTVNYADQASKEKIIGMLDNASKLLNNLTVFVAGNQGNMEDAQKNLANSKLEMEEVLGEFKINMADMAALIQDSNALELQLKALFQAISVAARIALVDWVR